ncbi:FAD-dependent monooxygenase [Yinghuangia sp. ASG 101]|uniref:FAD-dependent monooxygenase n=1 Tax=Yinghuangia sp. ASG 101 TaxID=2896848 RepID=UPI001E5AD037|nr:FAD-dependent monooxygenase [Yinghuangia sp. ASG 101]UGQ12401.1 FAD-dependent monooxygenase [Yinghuangia sp. ASG 101]
MSRTVIVVGGGPTGLMLACELKLAGIKTILLEKSPVPRNESRGTGLHARSLELLDQRGIGERLRAQRPPVWDRVHFALFWLQLEHFQEHEYTLVVPQWRTEQLLEERAHELGVDFRRGYEVLGLEQDADGVTLTVRSPDGERELRAAYVVGADGAASVVRSHTEITSTVLGAAYYGVLGDAEAPLDVTERLVTELHEEGLYGEILLEPGTVRLMSVEFGRERTEGDTPVTREELWTAINRVSGRTAELPPTKWLSRFGGKTRNADSYRDRRVFIAGDAAHVHYPAGAQGLNTGINDAVNLGWKLAATLHGWAPEGLLDTYSAERVPVGERVCMNTQAQVSLKYPLPRNAALREVFGELLRFPEVRKLLIETVTGLDVRYPTTYPGLDGRPEADLLGRRLADTELVTPEGPSRITRTLHAGRPVLLDLSGGTADLTGADGWTDRVDVVTAEPVEHLPGVLVLRPDGHVAWADADGKDAEGLRGALAAWFGDPVPVPVG